MSPADRLRGQARSAAVRARRNRARLDRFLAVATATGMAPRARDWLAEHGPFRVLSALTIALLPRGPQ